MWIPSTITAAEREALRMLQSLQWLLSTNLFSVIIELDSKQVVTDISKDKIDLSESGSLIVMCKTLKTLLSLKNNYKVVFTGQQANNNAHALAQAFTIYATHKIFTFIPHCIWTILSNEMS